MGKWEYSIRSVKRRMLHLLRLCLSGPTFVCVAVLGGAAPGLLVLSAYLLELLGEPQPALTGLARWFILAGGALMALVALLAAVDQAYKIIHSGRRPGEGD